MSHKATCESCGVGMERPSSQRRFCAACVRARAKAYQELPEIKKKRARLTRERRAKSRKHMLSARMSANMYQALRGRKAGRRWEVLAGYGVETLAAHLEKQFSGGMSWANYGAWHIDHIRPKVSFQYDSETDEQFRACWALANLRPLWARENKVKSDARAYLV